MRVQSTDQIRQNKTLSNLVEGFEIVTFGALLLLLRTEYWFNKVVRLRLRMVWRLLRYHM
jgi:hypothetical protein